MDIFSPLGREYCAYFYWLTVLAFIFLLIALYRGLVILFRGKFNVLNFAISLIAPFLLYFQNRLLYSMCLQ